MSLGLLIPMLALALGGLPGLLTGLEVIVGTVQRVIFVSPETKIVFANFVHISMKKKNNFLIKIYDEY